MNRLSKAVFVALSSANALFVAFTGVAVAQQKMTCEAELAACQFIKLALPHPSIEKHMDRKVKTGVLNFSGLFKKLGDNPYDMKARVASVAENHMVTVSSGFRWGAQGVCGISISYSHPYKPSANPQDYVVRHKGCPHMLISMMLYSPDGLHEVYEGLLKTAIEMLKRHPDGLPKPTVETKI